MLLELVLLPNPIDVALLPRQEERPEPFDRVALETPAEFVPVRQLQRPEPLLAVPVELSLVPQPVVALREAEVVPVSWLLAAGGMLVVQHSEAVKAVLLPAARVAEVSLGVEQHPAPVQLVLAVELALVACAVAEEVPPVRPRFCRGAEGFYFAKRSGFLGGFGGQQVDGSVIVLGDQRHASFQTERFQSPRLGLHCFDGGKHNFCLMVALLAAGFLCAHLGGRFGLLPTDVLAGWPLLPVLDACELAGVGRGRAFVA